MRDRLPRITGIVLLVLSLVLLIFSPGKDNFSAVHFCFFIACFAVGMLLVSGMVGSHPIAAQLRREAAEAGIRRAGPLVHVPEQVFPYARSSFAGAAAAVVCAVLGFCLVGLGIFMERVYPSRGMDSVVAGSIPFAAGILCLWISIRYPGRHIQVTPQQIMLKGYFKTVTMPWHTILCLIAREHHVLTVGGFTPTGIMYSVYSQDSRLWFSENVQGSKRLASIIAEATGLTWQ